MSVAVKGLSSPGKSFTTAVTFPERSRRSVLFVVRYSQRARAGGFGRRYGIQMRARTAPWVAGCAAAVSVALLAGAMALSYFDRHLVPASGWDFSNVFEEATFMAVPAVGFVLASRRPGNRIGWIFLGAGLALGLGFFCQRYGQGGLVAAPGSLPAARAAAWFANWALATIPAAGLAFMLLLFPTGRLCSRRWRPAAWFVAAVFTLDAGGPGGARLPGVGGSVRRAR